MSQPSMGHGTSKRFSTPIPDTVSTISEVIYYRDFSFKISSALIFAMIR